MQIAWPYPIGKNRNMCIQIMFSFGKRILPEYHTCDVGLCNSMVRPLKLRCVFNKVVLVNHWCDILNYSYILLCFSNSYRYIGQKP